MSAKDANEVKGVGSRTILMNRIRQQKVSQGKAVLALWAEPRRGERKAPRGSWGLGGTEKLAQLSERMHGDPGGAFKVWNLKEVVGAVF